MSMWLVMAVYNVFTRCLDLAIHVKLLNKAFFFSSCIERLPLRKMTASHDFYPYKDAQHIKIKGGRDRSQV